MSELYRDFIDNNMDDVITALNGTITPTPVNSELYRDFLNRKADDVITALNGTITPAPIGDELYRNFIERKFDDVIAGIGSYIPPVSFPTVSGSIVTFNSQYVGLPLKSHTVDIDSVSGVSEIIIGNCDNDIAYLWTVDNSFNGAVLFNQIYNYTSGSITGLGVSRTITNGLISFSGESTGAGNSVNFAWTDFTVPNGHKVIVLKDFTLPEGDFIFDQYNGYRNVDITNTIMNISTGYIIPQLKVSGAGHDYTGISGHLSVIDLTVLFNSTTIADYIYSLEQGEAGAGVAFFKHMYPDNYYPYNTGTKQGVGNSTTISIGSTVNEATYNARTGVLEVTQPSVQTLQLPPCPIDTLEGVNNIFADTGNTTLQYIQIGGNT